MNFLSFLRSAAILAACFHLAGCATEPPMMRGDGVIIATAPGVEYTYTARAAGSSNVSGLRVPIPQACAGRMVSITVEVRTQGVTGGSLEFHGLQVSHETFVTGHREAMYPGDYLEDPSDTWKPVSRQWAMPSDLSRSWLRVILQGVNGQLWLRNLRATC